MGSQNISWERVLRHLFLTGVYLFALWSFNNKVNEVHALRERLIEVQRESIELHKARADAYKKAYEQCETKP